MKKINKIILVIVMFFTFSLNANAETISWDDITKEWLAYANDDTKVTADENNLKIVMDNHEGLTHTVEFKYENDIVSFVKPDLSNVSQEMKVNYCMADLLMAMEMLNTVAKVYDVNLELINEDDSQASNYGITLETVPLHYENNGISIGTDEIIKFEIDLDKFATSTAHLKGTYEESEITQSPEPKVTLALENAGSNQLQLAINVSDLRPTSIASCDIYIMPLEHTSGESKIIGTIDNCVNGKNLYTVPNLLPNTKYSFVVKLNETFDITNDLSTTIMSEMASFSTTPVENMNNITNPKTGFPSISKVIGIMLLSIATAIIIVNYYKKSRKESKN